MNLFDELKWRGLVYDVTEGLAAALAAEPITAYVGFDPTASSLHIGNLLGLMTLARLQRHGHSPIAIAGGGTGMIGDPSGKAQERALLTLDQIASNVEGIKPQLAHFLDFERPRIRRVSSTTPTGWRRSICSGFFATPASISP